MNARRGASKSWMLTAACVLASGLVAACGGADPATDASAAPAAATSTTGEATLAKPLYARCSLGSEFAKPKAVRSSSVGGGWRVGYLYDLDKVKRVPQGATTSVMIVESAPGDSRGTVRGGTEETIAGRSVSLARPTADTPTFAARWQTGKANYIALVNGDSTKVLERVVRCMP